MQERLKSIWAGMKQRCYNLKSVSYKNYGGRGITVCEEWRNDFQAFYDWAMANGYADDLTIDRIDNNGNYEPSNCRWATKQEQANNRQTSVHYTVCGETHSIAEWARIIKKHPAACNVGLRKHGVEYIEERLPVNPDEIMKGVFMKRNKLRALRVLHDLTQDEMANRLGVSRSEYGKIEQGKRKGSTEFWVKLKNEFCLTAEEAWRVEYEN